MAARLETSRAGVRPVTVKAAGRRAGLAWPRLSAAAELATIGAGYGAYSLVRLAIRAGRGVAFAHAAQLWQAERWLHLAVEPYLNHLAAAHLLLAEAAGYYYGLAHFLITPLVLAWLYLRRPPPFPRLRSALVLATSAANIVFWTWPAAPPRFSVPGMTDVLVRYHILGAGAPHGPDTLVNLYAAMPSLHVAWAAWCAVAVVTRHRHPVAAPGLALPRGHHRGRARLRQPLRPGRGRRGGHHRCRAAGHPPPRTGARPGPAPRGPARHFSRGGRRNGRQQPAPAPPRRSA